MPKKNARKKEENAEDYCFFCKDGGFLRVCDYKNCLKTYHPKCVGRDDSLLETDDRWMCGWHFCFLCEGKPAKFHCYCCPKAVCGKCLCDAEFAVVKGHSGFCISCLEYALLIEDDKNVNSIAEKKVDFNDRTTFEWFFKVYWELVKVKEGLTLKQLHSADRLLKDGKNYDNQANCNYREEDIIRDFEDDDISEGDDWIETQRQCRKRKKGKLSVTRRKGESKEKEKEYVGWASKQLNEFLMYIDKDTTQELSQYDVVTMITEYCNDHKLFDPVNKKKVLCDERLQSLFGRKFINRNGIFKLLTNHFSENLEQSDDSIEFDLKEDDNVYVPCKKRQRKSSPDRKFEEKEIAATIPRESCLAAIVSRNIKLVYLKRSLVLELAKELDTFQDKMVGSFVKIKSDPNALFRKNSHMLVQVKGIKESSVKEAMNSRILLRVSNMVKDIPVCELSDDDFTEEEIEDLNRRMGTRVLERPTVLQLEQKARSLHEDLTKYRIKKELALLKRRIDQANEKGWRKELSAYMVEMQLLQAPSEQLRQIQEVPYVVAEEEVLEPEPTSKASPREHREEHKASPKSALTSVPIIQKCSLDKNVVSCCRNDGTDAAEVKEQDAKKAFTSTTVEGDERTMNQNSREVKPSCPWTSVPQLSPQDESADGKHCDAASPGENLPQPVDIGEHLKVENHQVEAIELSDEEIQDARTSLPQHKDEDPDNAVEKSPRPVDIGQHLKVDVIEISDDDEIQYARTSVPASADAASKTFHPASAIEKQPHHVDVFEHAKVEAIEVSDEKLQDARVATSQQTSEDHECSIWYCISPLGNTLGPYSMNVLKEWTQSSSNCRELRLRSKVYKSGQKPADAVLLDTAIRQRFSC